MLIKNYNSANRTITLATCLFATLLQGCGFNLQGFAAKLTNSSDMQFQSFEPAFSKLAQTAGEKSVITVDNVCSPSEGWICMPEPLLPSDTIVGAWYSIYFYEKNGTDPDHWSDWTRYKPELGYYDSGDVIKKQYPYFKRAGVNYLLLDHTNGWFNDGGRIANNAKKVLNNLPSDIPVAMAGGFPLWNGQWNANERVIQMKNEADLLWNELAQKPNYLKWFDPSTNSYKPLFIVYNDLQNEHPNDEIKRYWKDSRFTVRYSAGDTDSRNRLLWPYAAEGLWGWLIRFPQITSKETMPVQPGHNTTHLPGRTAIPVLRNGGQSYMQQWLEILKQRPQNIIIPSWNDWGEETAIEPARRMVATAELHADHYGEETPDWYLQITEGYTNLRKGLMPNTYYRSEDDSKVYKVEGGKLVYQTAMPHRKPIIILPAGTLAKILLSSGSSESTVPGGPSGPTAPSNPTGPFMVGINLYNSTGSTYCYFPSMELFTKLTGLTGVETVPRYSAIPSGLVDAGVCTDKQAPTEQPISEGLFVLGTGIYYSNGTAYCYFPSMELYKQRTGRSEINGVRRVTSIPAAMKNDGDCK
ncbi:MAG: hypothetical protein HUU57_03125 [Bdellovibrio sp.]|nr:hypothetical protein [Bdellovibrio sp.]